MDDDNTSEGTGGLSRRDMLRKSALVGGTLVWVAPAVQTLAAPAFANGSTTPGDQPCKYKFGLKWNKDADDDGVHYEANYGGQSSCYPVGYTGPGSGDPIALGSPGAATTSITLTGPNPDLYLGTVTASQGTGDCFILDFDLVAGYNINESTSYYIVKDGGGPDCESEDGGLLGTPNVDASYTLLSGPGDRYQFCGDGAGAGFSHVDLFVCVDYAPTV